MATSDKRIIYTGDKGNVCIVVPFKDCELTIEELKSRVVPSGKSSTIVDKSVVPTDRSFRDAWVLDGTTIKTDMAKAKEVHKEKIRQARNPKLVELDVEFQKAQETSASTTDIVAKKQALRDAPADSAIASASDEAALKAQWNTTILGTTPYTS